VIVLDTSGLLAALDRDQPDHESAAPCVADHEPRLLSLFVLAELDYLLSVRVGQGAETAFSISSCSGWEALSAPACGPAYGMMENLIVRTMTCLCWVIDHYG
jgi:hypothetical protein